MPLRSCSVHSCWLSGRAETSMPQKRMRVWCPLMAPGDHELGERLAARTLELIDIPSESRDEASIAAHVAALLPGARDLGDTALLAGPEGARVLLGGHFDTVPAQGNRPGRREGNRVIGLGASDMKGALAVMIELVRDGLPFGALFFGREELPLTDSALTPLLERHPLSPELVVMMEPTDNALHAGCLGNLNATWTFHGVAGHSARPWFTDNAITRAAAGVTALAAHEPEPHAFEGLEFVEVASVTKISGGIAMNVIPGEATAHVNYRYAPGRTPEAAEARLAELCAGHGELRIDANAPSGAVARGPLVDALVRAGDLAVAPKQAWTPVAEFGLAGLPAVNFGPGDPPQAHTREEAVSVEALVRSYRVLERFAAELSSEGPPARGAAG